MKDPDQLQAHLPLAVRQRLEQAYYARVNEQARLSNLVQDPEFWHKGGNHPALFSDHGVVHVRDVAGQILQVLQTANGVLLPRRQAHELEDFLNGYGVLLAYLHDIGMRDLSPFGRSMHPEYAAQAVFSEELEDVVEGLWAQQDAPVARRVRRLAEAGVLQAAPQTVLRELLAMAVGHSKSKMPVALLNDPPALRTQMQYILSHSLAEIHQKQRQQRGREPEKMPAGQTPPQLAQYYRDFALEAFSWLESTAPEAQALAADVTDTLRALRCADALRQRGTVQKTSGGYEVFMSQQSGAAVVALRLADDSLFLLELADPMGAGEANIASSELTPDGNLQVSFQRGAYASEAALQRAAYSSAFAINDFQYDVLDSFQRGGGASPPGIKPASAIQVLLESSDDNPRFSELVREYLEQLSPAMARQAQVVPSLRYVFDLERRRYLSGRNLDWDAAARQAALERMQRRGMKIEGMDLQASFRHVRLVELRSGERLIEAGTPSAFVYLPLAGGLRVVPLGGYASFSVAPWMPLGNTGVIRGDVRNADVVAVQDVALLVIPKEVYLQHWYLPYTLEELHARLEEEQAGGESEQV